VPIAVARERVLDRAKAWRRRVVGDWVGIVAVCDEVRCVVVVL
jgi:hypothetical protein